MARFREVSILKDSQLIQPVAHHVTQEIARQVPRNLREKYRPTVAALAQPVHLSQAPACQLGTCLLLRMVAKRPEEAREAREASPGIPKTQDQVPVQRELETFVYRAPYAVPDPAPPEKSLLRYVVRLGENVVIVQW